MASGQDITFIGGINTDDDVRFVGSGDYRSSAYMRSGSAEGQNAGAAESMPGNLLIENANLPAGQNTVVGSAKWVENESIVYFVHNSNGDHTLWAYNTISHVITIVLGNLDSAGFGIPNVAGSTLNLSRDFLVYHANVVDNILYWTDNYNPPRKLDLNKAIKYMETGGNSPEGYSFISFTDTEVGSKTIDVLKAPPTFIIEAEYDTDETRNFNKLYGNQYQFRYQYVYENNEESKWSMISKQPFPPSEEFISGRDIRNSLKWNVINLTYYTGPKNVKQINFAYRRGENGNWLVFKQLDLVLEGVSNLTNQTLVFDDNTAPSGATLTDILYDNVPQVAKCQEVLPNQSIAYGNFYADYDLVQDLDIQAERVLNELYDINNTYTSLISIENVRYPSDVSDPFTQININYNTSLENTFTPGTVHNPTIFIFQAQDVISIPLFKRSIGISSLSNYFYEVTEEDVFNPPYGDPGWLPNPNLYDRLITNIYNYFIVQYPEVDWSLNTIDSRKCIVVYDYKTPDYSDTEISITNSEDWAILIKFGLGKVLKKNRALSSLKKGSKKVFGIQYYDRGNRSNTVQTLPSMELDIPLPGQEEGRLNFQYNIDPQGFYGSQSAYTVSSKFTINHLPPDWATHYSILVKKDELISSFMQTTVTGFSYDPIKSFLVRLQLDKVPNSESVDYYTSKYTGATFYHTPSKGDRVRFITQETYKVPYTVDDGGLIVDELFLPSYYNVQYTELEVVEYDPSTNSILVNDFDYQKIIGGATNSVGSLIEIYTPKKDVAEDIWYEIEKGDIYSDEETGVKYHAANGQYQTATQPAILESDYGDVTYRMRDLASGLSYLTFQNYADMTNSSSAKALNAISWTLDGDTYDYSTYIYDGFNFITIFRKLYKFSNIYFNLGSKCYFIEDYNYSDYYNSDGHGRGRIGIENNKTQRTHYKTGVIHSAPYVAGSYINGLSSFDTLGNAEYLDDTYGPINRLKQVGYTLKALQDRKEVSIYIQRSYATSADGSGQLAYTSKTFGGINPSDSSYGCIHPGSVQVIGNDMYYYDFYTGAIIRSSNNGQTDMTVGPYKFNYWITKKTNRIATPEYKTIAGKQYQAVYTPISFVDESNSEYVLNFIKMFRREDKFDGVQYIYDSNEAPVFNFAKDRWVTFVYFNLNWGENLGVNTYTFSGGNLFEQNVSFLEDGTPNELTFYGIQEKMQIEFVMNDVPLLIKRPLSIGFRSNKVFSVPEITTIGNASYPAMLSMIYSNNFKLKEGYWWAAYLRDMNTPNQDPNKALVNGRELRSYAITHKAQYDGNEKAVLFDVKCSYVPSEALI